MICDRCHGCLIREALRTRQTRQTRQTRETGLWWWKCLNCGERIDAKILRHRAEQDAAQAIQRAALERDLKEWSLWLARLPA